MEGFDFAKAVVDPWQNLDLGQRFYVVVIRTRAGEALLQLIAAASQKSAIEIALGNVAFHQLVNVRDVAASDLSDFEMFTPREIQKMAVEKLGGSE